MSAVPRNIREDIMKYVPGIECENSDHGFEKINILLLGFTGQGKSSLINSCMCVVLDREYKNEAGAGALVGGKTTRRTSHKITDTIRITDNRGFSKMKQQEILEVCAQLRNLRKQEGDVEWEKDSLKSTLGCIPENYEQPKEFVLPVIVHSCTYDCKGDEEKSMALLIKKCQEITKIPPVAVITKVGPANNKSGNSSTMEKKFRNMGCTKTICLENYTENNQTKSQEGDNQFLGFLQVCVNEAEHAIRKSASQDPHKIFAVNVANQVKEEDEVKESERKKKQTELEEELNKVKRELEEEKNRPWYKKCSIM